MNDWAGGWAPGGASGYGRFTSSRLFFARLRKREREKPLDAGGTEFRVLRARFGGFYGARKR